MLDLDRITFEGNGVTAWQVLLKCENTGYSTFNRLTFNRALVGLQFDNVAMPDVGWCENNRGIQGSINQCAVGIYHSASSGDMSQARHRYIDWDTWQTLYPVWATPGVGPYGSSYIDWTVLFDEKTPNGAGFRFDGPVRQIKVKADLENPNASAGNSGLKGVWIGPTATEVNTADFELNFVHRGWDIGHHIFNETDQEPRYLIRDETRREVTTNHPFWEQ
jgi:hypothetical protein